MTKLSIDDPRWWRGPARETRTLPTPLVLRGPPTDPQTRVGWYGSVSQVLNQQGHDAGAERGLQCLPNLGF